MAINVNHLLIFGISPYIFFVGIGLAITYPIFLLLCYIMELNVLKNTFALGLSGIGLILGAKALGIISNWFNYIRMGESIGINNFLEGGIVFYGGLLGFITVFILILKLQKRSIRENLNIIAVCIPFFHAFARIGCFYAGCCYGVEAHTFISIYYATTSLEYAYRVPIQLIEASFNFVLFLILIVFSIKKILKQYLLSLLSLYLLLYSIGRFFLEFMRGDDARGYIGVLSVSQFISIIIFSIAIVHTVKININAWWNARRKLNYESVR